MDQVTQSSATETQELSHTARELADSATHLQRLTQRFRVREAASNGNDAAADELLAS